MDIDQEKQLSRAEFLKLGTLGAAGGAAMFGLAGCNTQKPAATSDPKRDPTERAGYVVAITHGPDQPDRVMLALTIASRFPAADNHVWFAIDGGPVCKKDEAEKVTSPLFPKQGNAKKLIEQIQSDGALVHI